MWLNEKASRIVAFVWALWIVAWVIELDLKKKCRHCNCDELRCCRCEEMK